MKTKQSILIKLATINCHAETSWHCDDESIHRSCVRITGNYDVTIIGGSCIDGITITQLFTFRIRSDWESTVWFSLILKPMKVHITNDQWYFSMVNNIRGKIHVRDATFSSFMMEKICGAMNGLLNDVIIYLPWVVRYKVKNNCFDPLKSCQTVFVLKLWNTNLRLFQSDTFSFCHMIRVIFVIWSIPNRHTT